MSPSPVALHLQLPTHNEVEEEEGDRALHLQLPTQGVRRRRREDVATQRTISNLAIVDADDAATG